jgi:hypothetical protein
MLKNKKCSFKFALFKKKEKPNIKGKRPACTTVFLVPPYTRI